MECINHALTEPPTGLSAVDFSLLSLCRVGWGWGWHVDPESISPQQGCKGKQGSAKGGIPNCCQCWTRTSWRAPTCVWASALTRESITQGSESPWEQTTPVGQAHRSGPLRSQSGDRSPFSPAAASLVWHSCSRIKGALCPLYVHFHQFGKKA